MLENFQLLAENPVGLLNLIIDGIMIGAVFALIAYGMALVWGVMNIINLTQGEYVIFGGFVAFYTAGEWTLTIDAIGVSLTWPGVHALWALIVAPAVLYAVGWGVYRLVIFRIVDRDMFTSILATFGISILLQQFMNSVFTADDVIARHGMGTWSAWRTDMGELAIERVRIVALAFALVVGGFLAFYLKNTRDGQAIRAVAQNARAARLMGIDADRVYARTYALNAALCGAAGVLVSMTLTIHAFTGLIYTVRAFMIVIIAGLGNVTGVIVAGLGLGAGEKVAEFLIGTSYQVAFVTGLLLVVLLYRSVRLAMRRRYLA